MIAVPALVEAVGGALLQLVVPGGDGVEDVTLAEPDEAVFGGPGDLVLGVGTTRPGQAVDLLERVEQAGACGLVLKDPLARDSQVIATAERLDLALVALQPYASWAHVVWLLRGVVDRVAASGTPALGDATVHSELFALADAASAVVDAPVTIEDPQSRVLAYSLQQEHSDPARVSTIVGRRVPDNVVAHFRARGVFRKLARSSEPLYVTDVPEGSLPRIVVPVRAGGEWLGSIWAVAAQPLPTNRVHELTRAASVLALHLLRLRAQADVAVRVSTDRLRATLTSASPNTGTTEQWLPPGPWRVVELGAHTASDDVQGRLDLWASVMRRFGWRQPLLADLDGGVFAVITVRDGRSAAGSLTWLRALLATVHEHGHGLTAAVGGPAEDRSELPRSRAEAAELGLLIAAGRVSGPTAQIEDAWYEIVTARARAAARVELGLLGGPLPVLVEHDRVYGTAYVSTLGAWLEHVGDPKAAAAALHIHRNTLRYRMQRIAEAAPLDLDSPPVRLALQLQISALTAARPST